MDNTRLQKIYIEAGRLFDRKGYPDTKMAEIAKASGIAVGTMYSMFDGKESVLLFVIRATLEKEYFSREMELPISSADRADLIVRLKAVLEEGDAILAVRNQQGIVTKDFLTLMGELFDYFADYLLALDCIEKNVDVLKELGEVYLPEKRRYFMLMREYLELYEKMGQITALSFRDSHIVFLTDTLTWWALNSLLAIPDQQIPRDKAKEICMGIIKRAYQAEEVCC